MYIEKLLLDNFKSFGRTTELPFYQDFTTVSGPNGSGKSNIIDAILFCLGLSRSSRIRAEKLTDLIYNPGDDNKSIRPNEAIVEVTLNNSSNELSRDQISSILGTDRLGDVSHIKITRRVKKTEKNYYSYYYVNDRSVNLSSIQELLSYVGITPEGYNVVMQGDVTSIIQMTPLQRRLIIDEIAGVAEFDNKKEKSISELDAVGAHVDAAKIHIKETQKQLQKLSSEREAALQYQKLKDEKLVYSSHLKVAEFSSKSIQLKKQLALIETTENQLTKLKIEFQSLSNDFISIESNLSKLNLEIERKGGQEQFLILKEIEELKASIARLEGELDSIELQITDFDLDRRRAFIELDQKKEFLNDIENQIRKNKLHKSNLIIELTKNKNQLLKIQKSIEDIGSEFEGSQLDLITFRKSLTSVQEERHSNQLNQDRLIDDARRRSNEIDIVSKDMEQVFLRSSEFKILIDNLSSELKSTQKEESENTNSLKLFQQERIEIFNQIESIKYNLNKTKLSYSNLENKTNKKGVLSFNRAVLSILGSDIGGIHGTVSQLGRVAEKYTMACEIAAGSRLSHIVVENDQVGQKCIEYLTQNNIGRATFLPLNKIKKHKNKDLPNAPGLIDFAVNLIEFESKHEIIFNHIFGSTIIFDNLQNARSFPGRNRLVTLSGDLIESSGAMTGGPLHKLRYNFVTGEQKNLQTIASKIINLESEQSILTETLMSIDSSINSSRETHADLLDHIRRIEYHLAQSNTDYQELSNRSISLNDQLIGLKKDRTTVEKQMKTEEEKIFELDKYLLSLESEISQLESNLSQSNLPNLLTENEKISAIIATTEQQLDSSESVISESNLEYKYLQSSITDLNMRIETSKNRSGDMSERVKSLESKIQEIVKISSSKELSFDQLESKLVELKNNRTFVRGNLVTSRDKKDLKSAELISLKSHIDGLVATSKFISEELEILKPAIELPLNETIPSLSTLLSNIEKIDVKMIQLEPVNMLAVTEYDSVEISLNLLTEKLTTLSSESAAIHERIDSYEDAKREAFIESFNGINEQFKKIFEKLSAGTGELHIEDENDPFSGGLTMIAKPRDKPLQKLAAMSGGEKSLTALSFIFAIQRYHPAPFYALDEIDAFLDASNAELVGELLDELAYGTQFIVVSHRSALLERSDRAIGVVMQENNISAVTGISLTSGDKNSK